MDKMIGKYMAFRSNEDSEAIGEGDTIIELTEVEPDGTVEIAFDVKAPKPMRIYLKLSPSALVQAVSEWSSGRR